MSTPQDSVPLTGTVAVPVGPPPRRASLLDIRFAFGSEAPPAEVAAEAAGGSVAPVAPAQDGPVDVGAEPPVSALQPGRIAAAPAPVFVTATMAELYRAQGMPERALDIYRTLLAREPERTDLAARVREMEAAAVGGEAPPPMLAALSFEDVRLSAVEAVPAPTEEPSARVVLKALGDRRVGGAIARDLGAAAAALGGAPLHSAVALDDAFADWT